jgi:glycosyltransferase involved in cell wall biosynthesis
MKRLIEKYTSKWMEDYASIKREMEKGLYGLNYTMEHIGSTSVPDLDSKPIIDIDIIFDDQEDFEKIKGAHTAIKVAKATGHKLIIAGNVSPLDDERSYFEKEIKPLIDDVQIQYVGAVNDEQKNFYLGQAKALLFPIEWNEPFGMVMIEAMACGTPVIGFRKGSVPEVITDGVTGFFTNDMEKMISAVSLIHSIDRKECRLISQSRFDITIIAKRYLQLFN